MPPVGAVAAVRSAVPRIAAWLGVSGVTFVLFFHVVHVGHEVVSPGAGVFRSQYTSTALEQLARARAQRWRLDPPVTLRRLSREDQFLAEANFHAQRRNRAWNDGDIFTAWRENLILERHYAPVLDAPSYVSATGQRWPSEQRADAEARSGDTGQAYVSDAYPFPIYVWPRWATPLLLLKIILVPGLVAGVTLAVRRWGPAIGGWLAGLPLVAGPVLVFYGIEQGPAFASRAAQGTMAAMAANAVFSVLYAWLARSLPWYVCILLGWGTFAAAITALETFQPGLAVSLALPIAAALVGSRVMPRAESLARGPTVPAGDLAIRMFASAAVVVTLTSLAERLGPAWSGLLAAFPVIITTVAAFTHVQRGPAAVAAFFRGFVPATIGFVLFCLMLAVLMPRWGVLPSTVVALAVQLVLHGTVVRWLTPTAAPPTTLPT
jgi:hypothetical protein